MARPKFKEERGIICICGLDLKSTNWSNVRKKYYCPVCSKDYTKEDIEVIKFVKKESLHENRESKESVSRAS